MFPTKQHSLTVNDGLLPSVQTVPQLELVCSFSIMFELFRLNVPLTKSRQIQVVAVLSLKEEKETSFCAADAELS